MQAYNICCKIDPDFFLVPKNGQVVFARANQNDENQKWYIHWRGSSFAVVHAVTNQAIKHTPRTQAPFYVGLTPYSNNNDTSILWTEANVDNQGYKGITSPINNSYPFWYAHNVVVNEGNYLVQWTEATSNPNGRMWKMIPNESLVRIQSKLHSSLFLSIRNNRVVLATSNASDGAQQWNIYKSADGSSFVVVNKYTGQAIQQPQPYEALELVSNFNMEDVTLKWTKYEVNDEDGSTAIKMANHFTQVWDVEKGLANDGTPIFSWKSGGQKTNQRWIITPIGN